MIYHTSQTASADELCGRAEWTLDHAMNVGFERLLTEQEQYLEDFWRRSDVIVQGVRSARTKREPVRDSVCEA
jgi:alpha,alpha-trehalose phosphorylase